MSTELKEANFKLRIRSNSQNVLIKLTIIRKCQIVFTFAHVLGSLIIANPSRLKLKQLI